MKRTLGPSICFFVLGIFLLLWTFASAQTTQQRRNVSDCLEVGESCDHSTLTSR
jgi:hypothetical protein